MIISFWMFFYARKNIVWLELPGFLQGVHEAGRQTNQTQTEAGKAQSEEERSKLIDSIQELDGIHKSMPCKDPMDQNFRRLQYVRYILSP